MSKLGIWESLFSAKVLVEPLKGPIRFHVGGAASMLRNIYRHSQDRIQRRAQLSGEAVIQD